MYITYHICELNPWALCVHFWVFFILSGEGSKQHKKYIEFDTKHYTRKSKFSVLWQKIHWKNTWNFHEWNGSRSTISLYKVLFVVLSLAAELLLPIKRLIEVRSFTYPPGLCDPTLRGNRLSSSINHSIHQGHSKKKKIF